MDLDVKKLFFLTCFAISTKSLYTNVGFYEDTYLQINNLGSLVAIPFENITTLIRCASICVTMQSACDSFFYNSYFQICTPYNYVRANADRIQKRRHY